jgi:hypothetical protein
MQLLADRYPLIDTSLMQAENRLERPGAVRMHGSMARGRND